jgi:small subunit ribosomal protein S2
MRATIEDLLLAGAHFGHLTRRWNPKMKKYIFMERNGIHIIDLKKTHELLQDVCGASANLIAQGKNILFVGTKKQAKDVVKNEAVRCGMNYVTERWLGGMLTNFSTIRKSIKRLNTIIKMETDGTFDNLQKKERLILTREKEKLEKVLGGISTMNKLPGAVYIVDIKKEHIAVDEAKKLEIPIIAIVDTNCDPDLVNYPVPSNDDAVKSIELITRVIADAIIDARSNVEMKSRAEAELEATGTDVEKPSPVSSFGVPDSGSAKLENAERSETE